MSPDSSRGKGLLTGKINSEAKFGSNECGVAIHLAALWRR
jgi:hypothetical protein